MIFLIAFAGAKRTTSAWGYGFPLFFGPMTALLTSVVLFVLLFRRIRAKCPRAFGVRM
jgi:hypothetical protein